MGTGGGGGHGGGGGPAPTETWRGTYLYDQADTWGQGVFCAELSFSGGNVSGRLYVAGAGYVGEVQGSLSGNTIRFGTVSNAKLLIEFSGTLSGDHANGTFTDQTNGGIPGTWSMDKTADDGCGWASDAQVSAFASALSAGDSVSASVWASFITVLPSVQVKIDGRTETWPICIWEIDDQDLGFERTLGAAVSPDNDEAVAWVTGKIHEQTTSLAGSPPDVAAYFANLNSPRFTPSADAYVSTTGEYRVTADSDPPPYDAKNLLYDTGCRPSQPKRFRVYMTELGGHLQFTGANSASQTVDVAIPPTDDFSALGALHVRTTGCP